ncbi:MAG: protein kinase [Candidatus Krumholzibacteria bacterium]|nr:protein kinase [Candidatus Krumholzibacteria bacterium]
MIGRTISHYRIVEKIGEGGMGAVYKAEDTKLKRFVALKFLPPHLTGDPDAVARFEREAQAAAALNHPNIITVHEIGEYERQVYIGMEYVEGRTLREMIHDKPLPLAQALDIAIQIGEGLAKAHKAQIVHRDLKPDNVLIDNDGRVKILDFGLAKLRGVTKLTKESSTLGTVAYMSPEQALGKDVDHRTDIWSLGVILYEMTSGRAPFRGQYAEAVHYSIINEMPEPLTGLRTGVPLDMERFVDKAMAKNPRDRYPHIEDLVVDLRGLKRELEGASAGASRSHAPGAARPARRTRLFGAIAAVLVLVAVAAYFLRPRESASPDRKSIAVLPFQNLSAEPENEYFSDGITEDIITQLSKIADLRVISRTSIMRYKGSDQSLRDIGKELGVATILEGSVRRAGDRVRIVSQLIDVRTDEHLWAETYDRQLSDIFAIQSDVARNIAAALEAALTPDERTRIASPPTRNMAAYDYYLRGRDAYNKYRQEEMDNAVYLFKQALEEDPGFALAYAGLADAYAQQVMRFGYAAAWTDSALSAAQTAIALDAHSAEGYKALGLAYQDRGWMGKAIAAQQKAVEYNPNYAPAVANLGFLYSLTGRPDEGVYWLRRSMALEPVPSGIDYILMGYAFITLDMPDVARQWFERGKTIRPDLSHPRFGLVMVSVLRNDIDAARTEAEDYIQLRPQSGDGHSMKGYLALFSGDLHAARVSFERSLGLALAAKDQSFSRMHIGYVMLHTGHADEGREVLEETIAERISWIDRGDEDPETRYFAACAAAALGQKDEAYHWLEQAIDYGFIIARRAEREPLLATLRDEQRFQEMMAALQAKVAKMRERVVENGWATPPADALP